MQLLYLLLPVNTTSCQVYITVAAAAANAATTTTTTATTTTKTGAARGVPYLRYGAWAHWQSMAESGWAPGRKQKPQSANQLVPPPASSGRHGGHSSRQAVASAQRSKRKAKPRIGGHDSAVVDAAARRRPDSRAVPAAADAQRGPPNQKPRRDCLDVAGGGGRIWSWCYIWPGARSRRGAVWLGARLASFATPATESRWGEKRMGPTESQDGYGSAAAVLG